MTGTVGKGSGLGDVAVGVGESVGGEAVGEGKFASTAGEAGSGVAVGFTRGKLSVFFSLTTYGVSPMPSRFASVPL